MTGILHFPSGAPVHEVDRAVLIEFDEAAFPALDIEEIETRVYSGITRAIDELWTCPYCEGRGTFDARIQIGGGIKAVTAKCGQCMGEGKRDDVDARSRAVALLTQLRDLIAAVDAAGNDDDVA